jgi:hypothetical protein
VTETATKHTCNPDRPGMPLPFGRKAPAGECPRCDELRAGAAPRRPDWVENLRRAERDEEMRRRELKQHFAQGGPHDRGDCRPVCTFGDW